MSVLRFRDLVKRAGTPEPKSLWTDPKKDRDFMRAVKQHRVLTVRQESSRKDFGELGFHQHPGALYFIFPKPLPADEGKVIGIKYDLVEPGEPSDMIPAEELKRAAKTRRSRLLKTEQTKLAMKTFQVAARRVAAVDVTLSIEAHSKGDAKRRAVELLKTQNFDLAKADIQNEIKSVQRTGN